MRRKDLASVIDHTLLSPKAGREAVREVVEEYNEHGFASVCCYPADLLFVPDDVRTCTVLGFPHGKELGPTLARAADQADRQGADEIDVVLDRALVRQGRLDDAVERLEEPLAAFDGLTKVIVEACDLDEPQLREAVGVCVDAGADFVKTSTGLGEYGARIEDVGIIADALEERGADLGIKASGGVSSAKQVDALREAAGREYDPDRFRIGASRGVQIVREV